ncbi:ABC transporter ATP-binding protein [Brevibacillus choshinensis]|uniref:ABC transporter ATP-binding protein n=1 Tax=Brevibacillus choshinensis TaxID=54911 RepID=A0ABX7FGM1_BRECH|nr:ABC transporter ATP-binding protein [Brevibacillus choshinensis]QRG65344.1 ABC transporter ATP-binding protein [Brevibacillus choshinensis]
MVIETLHLSKRYGNVQALTDLNLSIEAGKVFGFIGPNGAGKSTTMLILSTLLEQTEGDAFVCGYNVRKNPEAVRQSLGYMPDFFGVYDNLTAVEYLEFYAGAFKIPARKRSSLVADLLELVNLSHKADAYVDSLSRGMQQRLGLARCLVHDPSALILDEPASGLDPRARIELREIIKQLRGMGKTILISSHILPELAELCDEIGVIERGRLIACGSVHEVSKDRGRTLMELKTLGHEEEAAHLLNQSGRVFQLEEYVDGFQIRFEGNEQQKAELLQQLIAAGIPVVFFGDAKENLEDMFLAITEGVSG